MSTSINCQDCDVQWEVPDEEIPLGIQDDQLLVTRGRYGTIRYFGICDTCKGIHRARRVVEEDEFLKLLRTRDWVRKLHPEFSLEQACRGAVEILNDPRREPNLAYRVFLLEWTSRRVRLPQWVLDERVVDEPAA